MESRKDLLQKQIIDAIKANDDDLYALLKSQWAHRFGVESLDELRKLDINQENQTPNNKGNLQIDESQSYFVEDDKSIFLKDDDNQEKEIKNDTEKVIDPSEIENKESCEIKSYEIVDKDNYENKAINRVIEYKNPPKVEALIPLPPKPKYSYLKKWLLRS